MIPVLTAKEMRECDRRTMEEYGVPSCVLMERAAYETALAVEDYLHAAGKKGRVLVLTGSGNNGGDGYACARILSLRGASVEILPLGNPDHMTAETKRQFEIIKNIGVPLLQSADFGAYTVIVDAVLGIGLVRDVSGPLADTFRAVNKSGAKVVSVDIPSGIDSDTGAVRGCAVRADETVTMQAVKRGLLLYPGADYAGDIRIAEIGVAFTGQLMSGGALEIKDLPDLLPVRKADSNKGTYGKVLLIAGSRNMAGAAYLSGLAALRSGAGMVRIVSSESNREILQQMLPEAMLATYDDPESAEECIRTYLPWCDAAACGPGLGITPEGRQILKVLFAESDKPLVLDADALNVISEDPSRLGSYAGDLYVTPHPGEMKRLTGSAIPEILGNLPKAASDLAGAYKLTCVLKDASTVTADPEGMVMINLSGNCGMATAGSGDVLTGMLASLLGQGMRGIQAASTAVFLHGLSGDAACRKLGTRYMKAGDIIEGIEEVFFGSDEFTADERR
ncbi:MAG: NAD(P)H-hydrate dehydratase [Lachnospiraceae bacterium]|nr:NAD(P)H-hydrate dehydratase [Lachnospiraceae bacterium]